MNRRVSRWCLAAFLGLLVALGYFPAGLAAEGIVVPVQRVENWTFKSLLRAWDLISPATSTSATWSPATASPDGTGSAQLTASSPSEDEAEIAQCIPNLASGSQGVPFAVEAMWSAPPNQALAPNGGQFVIKVERYSGNDCQTGPLGDVSIGPFSFGPSGAPWQLVSGTVSATLSISSARIILRHRRLLPPANPPGSSSVLVDEVQLLGGRSAFVKGDFDGGAETDLLLRNTTTNEHRVWFMNNEERVVEAPITPALPTAGWQVVGVDDFNADGRNDLLIRESSHGWISLWLMNGVARAGLPLAVVNPGLEWQLGATADFNHDGRPDIVFRNSTTQVIQIWTMNGSSHVGTILPNPDHAVDANWEIVGAGDLNGDGNTDLVWYNPTSGNCVYWLMDASVVRTVGTFTNPPSTGDSNWRVVAIGDYGIGPAGLVNTKDLVWRNATSGRMVVWFMDRSGNRTGGLFVTPDPPAPATSWTVVGPR